MKTSFENDVLSISYDGRIDTNNAAEIQESLESALNEYPTENVIIDLENLNYISSAGLRVMLKARKLKPKLKIINVQPAVYDVFETTGFTEMMDIEKGFRQVNLDGCEIIGEGSNGVVYRQDPETIVKVYKAHNVLADIERERELARTAFIKGIPTAMSFDIVKYNGQLAAVFELLNAVSISKLIARDNSDANIDKYAQVFVDVLKTIHNSVDDGNVMPDHKVVGLKWAEYLKDTLPQPQYDKLVRMINEVPDSNHILHGDYHTNNVLMQGDEPVLIDMDTLSHGDPIFEFASIYNAYLGFSALNHSNIEKFLKIDYETGTKFYNKALEKYFGTTDPALLDSIKKKAKLVGTARLLRRTIKRNGDTEEGKREAEHYKKELISLLDEVDDLILPPMSK